MPQFSEGAAAASRLTHTLRLGAEPKGAAGQERLGDLVSPRQLRHHCAVGRPSGRQSVLQNLPPLRRGMVIWPRSPNSEAQAKANCAVSKAGYAAAKACPAASAGSATQVESFFRRLRAEKREQSWSQTTSNWSDTASGSWESADAAGGSDQWEAGWE